MLPTSSHAFHGCDSYIDDVKHDAFCHPNFVMLRLLCCFVDASRVEAQARQQQQGMGPS